MPQSTAPVVRPRTSSTPCQSGSAWMTYCSHCGVDRDRVERRREQEHRQHDEGDPVHLLERLHVARDRHAEAREAEGDEQHRRQREQRPPREVESERLHHDLEADRVERPAQQGQHDLAERDVERSERGREHALVESRELHLEEDVPGRVVDGAVHGRDREQGGRDERRVGHDLPALGRDVADERAEADAHGEQVEDRLEEAAHHDEPVRAARRAPTTEHHGSGVARVQRLRGPEAQARGRQVSLRQIAHLRSLLTAMRRAQTQPTANIAPR